MKKVILSLLFLALVACAVASRPAIQYVAKKSQVQDAVLEFGLTNKISDFYDGWRVTAITDNSVTMTASTTTATSIFLTRNTMTLIVTMVEREGFTITAVSVTDSRGAAQSALEDKLLNFLDTKFKRLPSTLF